MLEYYKTINNITTKIDEVEPGCWISAVAPTEEEKAFLIEQLGVMPEFINSSLDTDESAHIDYDDDFDQTLVIFDYPSAEDDTENYSNTTLKYTTLPLGVVLTHEHIITICLNDNYNIQDMSNGTVKGVNTALKTRFLLLLLLRISQRFLIYLRQID